MRKFVLVMLVLFTLSVFALAGIAQRRGHARARPAGAATIPRSDQIAQELGGIQWGWTHDQVIDYYRRAAIARYMPLLRNKGQIEQDRLMQERDASVSAMRSSYMLFDGAQPHRRWDTSFVGPEYTHNNNESMLVAEDPTNGNREFFFFFNDRLWKRFQARTVPSGSGLDYPSFVSRIESLFGAGLHINDPDHPTRLATVVWQDNATRLHLVDNSTFYNSFCLVYEEKNTLSRLTELRANAPTKQGPTGAAQVNIDQPSVGNVAGDQNTDIVDRITGKMRRTTDGTPSSNNGASSDNNANNTPDAGAAQPAQHPANQGGNDSDPLRGL